jgi:hypothetical protein
MDAFADVFTGIEGTVVVFLGTVVVIGCGIIGAALGIAILFGTKKFIF